MSKSPGWSGSTPRNAELNPCILPKKFPFYRLSSRVELSAMSLSLNLGLQLFSSIQEISKYSTNRLPCTLQHKVLSICCSLLQSIDSCHWIRSAKWPFASNCTRNLKSLGKNSCPFDTGLWQFLSFTWEWTWPSLFLTLECISSKNPDICKNGCPIRKYSKKRRQYPPAKSYFFESYRLCNLFCNLLRMIFSPPSSGKYGWNYSVVLVPYYPVCFSNVKKSYSD